MRKTCCGGPCLLRLDLCCVYPNADGPGGGEYYGEHIYRDDDNPAASSEGPMYGVTCVEPANQEHCNADPDSAVYGTVPSAPFVGQDEGGDSDAEDDNCRDARREKCSF